MTRRLRIFNRTDDGDQLVGDLVVRGNRVEPASPAPALDHLLAATGVYDPVLKRQLFPTDGERYLDGLAEELGRSSRVGVRIIE